MYLDPVSRGTEVEKANKYNTNTLHTNTKFMFFPSFKVLGVMKTAESLSTEFWGTLRACCCKTFFSLFINKKMIDYYE